MASLAALVAATIVLVAIPGPNVALIVANSLAYGFRAGALTVLGTTLGVGLQLVLVVLGMAVLLESAAGALTWIRWAGVAYLVWLGVTTWRRAPARTEAVPLRPVVFWRGCLVAAANPKTLLFSAAFLPQFVAPGPGESARLALAAAVFLGVLGAGDLLWAAFAGAARPLLGRVDAVRNRIIGALLVVAGIGLAWARRGA